MLMENFNVSLDSEQPTNLQVNTFQPDSNAPSDTRVNGFKYSLFYDETPEPAQAIEVSNPAIIELSEPVKPENQWLPLMLKLVQLTENSVPFDHDNEIKFIYILSSQMNNFGIPIKTAVDFFNTNYKCETIESPESLIHNVYQWNFEQHGGLSVDSNQIDSMSVEELAALKFSPKPSFLEIHGNSLLDTKKIPDELLFALPLLLKEYVMKFPESRRRDVFLTSAFPVLASCLSDITAVYDGMTVHPVLNVFILAPPASGKGSMNYAISLMSYTHELELKQFQVVNDLYRFEKAAYDKLTRKPKENCDLVPPTPPKQQICLIPGNSSATAVIMQLADNDGKGLVPESEALTVSQTFSQEWGTWVDIILKSFHHETISIKRVNNQLYIYVNSPRLSTLLSGTPGQVAKIIRSRNDGLLTRFIFYVYDQEPNWLPTQQDSSNQSLTSYFREKSIEIHKLRLHYSATNYTFELTSEQKIIFDLFFADQLRFYTDSYGPEVKSIIIRMGLICFRIMMILTALTYYEHGRIETRMICTSVDFDLALRLITVYILHSLIVFSLLPDDTNTSNQTHENLINSLPNGQFTRSDAIKIGQSLGMSARNVGYALSNSDSIEKIKFGVYFKHTT